MLFIEANEKASAMGSEMAFTCGVVAHLRSLSPLGGALFAQLCGCFPVSRCPTGGLVHTEQVSGIRLFLGVISSYPHSYPDRHEDAEPQIQPQGCGL